MKMYNKRFFEVLTDIAVSLTFLYPDHHSYNPYQRLEKKVKIPQKMKAADLVRLYRLLVHGMTILHRSYRMRDDQGRWITERTDVILSLCLLQPVVWPQHQIGRRTKEVYLEILASYEEGASFTIRELMFRLRKPRSTLFRHVQSLCQAGYIEKVGGNKKRGFRYRLAKCGCGRAPR